MKLILAIFFSLVAFVYAAAIDVESRDIIQRAEDDGDIIASMLPDGRRKIDFYDEGVYQGYAIETDDGAQFFDAFGAEISMDDLVDDKSDLAKRASKWQIVAKLGKIIAKYGKRAWDFIYCVGFTSMLRCGDEYLDCAKDGIPPWSLLCVSGHACVGARAKECAGR